MIITEIFESGSSTLDERFLNYCSISESNNETLFATNAVDLILTCKIRLATTETQVEWRDIGGNVIDGGSEGYQVNHLQQAMAGYAQISTLTVSVHRLGALDTTSPLTWKCSAPGQTSTDVVVTFLSFGKIATV